MDVRCRERDLRSIVRKFVRADEVKALLIDLVRVPSPQTPLLEEEPLVRAFVKDTVAPFLKGCGLDVTLDSMGNLIARYGSGLSGKSLMLIGNAMNQPANTMRDPYEGRVVDGRPYGLPGEAVVGRGASEQKATLAAMLSAVKGVVRCGEPIDGLLWFVCCTSGESGRHDAIRHVVETSGVKADMAVLCGSSNQISLGNRGRLDIRVVAEGKACHSSNPAEGANAIIGCARVVERLLALPLEGEHPRLGRPSLTFTSIRSWPESTHTVQERCEMVLDRRLLPGEDPEEAFRCVVEAVSEVDGMSDPHSGKPIRVRVERGAFMYPSLVDSDTPVVSEIVRASRTALGIEPPLTFSSSAFDQGYLNHVGIPTCNYGPGEDSFAHTDMDMASVDRTVDAARVYACLVLDYLGKGDAC